jgi:formylglycine-generating enzyme
MGDGGRRRIAWLFLALSLEAGCQLLAGIDSRSLGTQADAASDSDATGASDAASDSDPGDAGPANDGMATADTSPAECPGTAGPASIHVKDGPVSFCIDRTEVTHGQYLAFAGIANPLAAVAPLIPECSGWLAPKTPPADPDELPVRDIAWCDAWAFCKWAGKRLCGAIGGTGAIDAGHINDPAHDEWFFACSKGGAQPLPYGATELPGNCNVGDGAALAPAASFPRCVGAYPDLHDMVGNISEFYDYVQYDDAGKVTYWGERASDWLDDDNSSCASVSAIDDVTHTYEAIGFRCCSDPL